MTSRTLIRLLLARRKTPLGKRQWTAYLYGASLRKLHELAKEKKK